MAKNKCMACPQQTELKAFDLLAFKIVVTINTVKTCDNLLIQLRES